MKSPIGFEQANSTDTSFDPEEKMSTIIEHVLFLLEHVLLWISALTLPAFPVQSGISHAGTGYAKYST
jgi:hypothetical protein